MSSGPIQSGVHEKFAACVKKHGIARLSAVLVRPNWSSGPAHFSNVDTAEYRPNDTTRYNICSLGKAFSAAAVLQLSRKRRDFTLNTQLNDCLAQPVPGWAGVTVGHLLTHSSGIPDYAGEQCWAQIAQDLMSLATKPPRPSISGYLRAGPIPLRLDAPPGSTLPAVEYTNTGYVLLAPVIAKCSGTPWDTFMAEEVFAQAGMQDTDLSEERPPATPDGGWKTTIKDMETWAAALYTDAVLPSNLREMLWTPRVAMFEGQFENPYGLGWHITDSWELDPTLGKGIWHDGHRRIG